MNFSIIAVFVCALAGAALGAIYLGLLWVAVRHLPQDRSGILVFVGLGVLRVALVIGALTVAAALALPVEDIVAAVIGFVAVRFAATRLMTGSTSEDTAWK